MTQSKNKCAANETSACCCVDLGTVIDDECTVTYEHEFPTEADANTMLASLTKIANDVASEPCKISSKVDKIDNGYKLTADFTFCCGAENMIFQLKLR